MEGRGGPGPGGLTTARAGVSATAAGAARLGADAVGYTLYVGSPAQERDFEQYRQGREDTRSSGMRPILWSYPRAEDIETTGGEGSSCAMDDAARSVSFAGQLTDILATYPSG